MKRKTIIISLISGIIILITCKELKKEMLVSTGDISSISTNSAEASGEVIDLGEGATQRGHCWAKTPNVDISASGKTQLGAPTAKGGFTSQLTNLEAGTKYYIKAYMANGSETAYGKEISFNTIAASLPTITTTVITSVTQNSASSGGNITGDGGAPVTERGVCWNTATGPTTVNSKVSAGNGSGNYPANLSGLTGNTTYYVRSYATNIAGTAYGNEIIFTTSAVVPGSPGIGTATAGNAQATVTFTAPASNGGSGITGYAVTSNPGNITGTGSASPITLTGLTNGTAYTFIVIATNAIGNSVASSASNSVTPSATSTAPGAPTIGTATAGNAQATVTFTAPGSNGGSAITGYTVTSSPGGLTGTGTTSPITVSGLTNGTAYTFTVIATNAIGNSVSSSASNSITPAAASTVPEAPTIGTAMAGNAQATVTFTAPVSNGGSAITGYSVTSSPGNITGTGTASPITVTGLTNGTSYTFTGTATNAIGNSVPSTASNSVTPSTPLPTVSDVDGNVYNTVIIGTQTWMKENLKTTKYRDGTAIPNVTDNTIWSSLTSGAYCWYNNDASTYKATYGALYNFYTTIDNLNLCPTGWHVPTDAEWTTLTTFLGGESIAGGKLKESGLAHWLSPNTGATNETGFTALSIGFRNFDGTYMSIGYTGYWWSSTEYSLPNAWHRYMNSESINVYRNYDYKQYGFSVRCLQGEGKVLPAVTTTSAASVTSTTGISGGNVTSDGGSTITQRGVCYNTATGPTTANSVIIASGTTGTFTSNLTGLTPSTTYFLRAFTTNSVGTVYGSEVSFTTSAAAIIPTVTTTAISAITQTTAIGGGNITSNGGEAITVSGICWSTTSGPTTSSSKTTDGSVSGSFTSNLTGLTANTTFFVRAYASNSAGTAYGNEQTFITICTAPSSTTNTATNVVITSATINGTVNANNSSTTVTFDYGTTTGYGSSIATTPSIVSGNSNTSVSAVVIGLVPNTLYHYRVNTVNCGGTNYGSDQTFNTAPTTLTDIDGNIYDVIQIGTQVWMGENLKTTHYSNTELIGTTTPATLDIHNESTPKYQWAYNGNESNVSTYGRLYTYYAVTDIRNVCPTGWHLPSNADWTILTNFLGGSSVAGGKLKEAGTINWWSPNTGATNTTVFTALPGGFHDGRSGGFGDFSMFGFWWSSTLGGAGAWQCQMNYSDSSAVNQDMYVYDGLSVRCVGNF